MKNKGIIVFLVSLLAMLLTLTSCGGQKSTDTGEKTESVENTKIYKKVVILDPAVVEMFYLLNAEDKITAIATMQTSGIWPEEKTKELPSVGTFSKPSLEQIISHEPDLVILNMHSSGLAKDLEAHGIESIVFKADSFDEIFDNFTKVGKLLGKEKEAAQIISEQKAKLEKLKAMKPLNKKGAFIYSTSPMMAFGDGSLPGEILKMYGVKNLTEGVSGERPILTTEYILDEDPDFLLIGMGVNSIEDITTVNPQLKEVKAVKNKNIIKVNSQLLMRGSPRIVDETVKLYDEIKSTE